MSGGIQKFEVRSRVREELIDISRQVNAAIRASGVSSGLCTVFIPHTTAAVTISSVPSTATETESNSATP